MRSFRRASSLRFRRSNRESYGRAACRSSMCRSKNLPHEDTAATTLWLLWRSLSPNWPSLSYECELGAIAASANSNLCSVANSLPPSASNTIQTNGPGSRVLRNCEISSPSRAFPPLRTGTQARAIGGFFDSAPLRTSRRASRYATRQCPRRPGVVEQALHPRPLDRRPPTRPHIGEHIPLLHPSIEKRVQL